MKSCALLEAAWVPPTQTRTCCLRELVKALDRAKDYLELISSGGGHKVDRHRRDLQFGHLFSCVLLVASQSVLNVAPVPSGVCGLSARLQGLEAWRSCFEFPSTPKVAQHVAVAVTSRLWLANMADRHSLAQVRPQALFDIHLFRAMPGTSCQHCAVCGQAFQPIQDQSKLCCTTVTMYHGTTREAADQIERSGFRPSTCGTLGPGVYASRDIKKARD